jgi:hypothetical protein
VVLLAIVAAAWIYRDKWLRIVPGARPSRSAETDVSVREPLWEPLSPTAAFTNLKGSEIASYVFQAAGSTFPAQADSVEAAVIGDVLYVRAVVPTKLIAGSGALGPLAGLLNERERVSLGGSFHVIRPGLSEFQLRDVKLRDFSLPRAAIPRLVQQITKGKRTSGVAADAIPVPTPKSLADVRIANNRVTLYKTTPGTTP